MINLLYVFLALVLLKLILNFPKYLRCKRYLEMYKTWLLKDAKVPMAEQRAQVVKLFKDAGVEDSFVPYTELAGYGLVSTGQASTFANFPNRREDMAQMSVRMFQEAIGVYRSRMIEAINPVYWIEFVIFLPRQLLQYLGMSAEHIVVKITNLLWWIASGVAAFLYALYKPGIDAFIKSWLSKIFP